jgi:hypothetical protein
VINTIFRFNNKPIARIERLIPSTQKKALLICKTDNCLTNYNNGTVIQKRKESITAHFENYHHLTTYVSRKLSKGIMLNFAKIPIEQLGNPNDDDRFLAYYYRHELKQNVKEALTRWSCIRRVIGCYSTAPVKFVKLYAGKYGEPEIKTLPIEI